jgi:hypothetical protein
MSDHTTHPDAGAPVERRAFEALRDASCLAEAIAFIAHQLLRNSADYDYEVVQYARSIEAMAENIRMEVDPVRDALAEGGAA